MTHVWKGKKKKERGVACVRLGELSGGERLQCRITLASRHVDCVQKKKGRAAARKKARPTLSLTHARSHPSFLSRV